MFALVRRSAHCSSIIWLIRIHCARVNARIEKVDALSCCGFKQIPLRYQSTRFTQGERILFINLFLKKNIDNALTLIQIISLAAGVKLSTNNKPYNRTARAEARLTYIQIVTTLIE